MNGRYSQIPAVKSGVTRFDKAPESGVEFSRMTEVSRVLTAFNAGDIVPVKCIEVLPNESYQVRVDNIIRLLTLKTPTMGEMICDFYAFFVPNRVVNDAWKNVQGENTSGAWTAPDVSLAPLYTGSSAVSIPVGSVADFYGLPTQGSFDASTLALMNDLPFRGYLAIYNEYFRDQNYQPPIPFSKANVYEGFLESLGTPVSLNSEKFVNSVIPQSSGAVSDGSFPNGSILKNLYGEGFSAEDMAANGFAARVDVPARKTSWSALDKPLKANKLHDALTSVLPSPQKGPDVTFSLVSDPLSLDIPSQSVSMRGNVLVSGGSGNLTANANGAGPTTLRFSSTLTGSGTDTAVSGLTATIDGLNGTVDLSSVSALSIDDLRTGAALQQLYEIYGRNGSRYREICHALFGVTADDPYSDIPKMLGHIRFPLELYQTAQTSASSDESPQGNLAAFGYTHKGGYLFHETFLEHGYVHVFCVVRQRNIYPAYLDPHWFRVNKLDFYTPIMANISEQPVYLRVINPFGSNPDTTVFGYQEAWWEYRQHPDTVTGFMRAGSGSQGTDNFSIWTYQDDFSGIPSSADADFMESNAQSVLDRTIAVTSENAPQFKALFSFEFDHVFPGPVYSVPGLDVI